MSHEHAVIARLLALVEPVRHSWIWCFSFHDAHHEEVGGGAFWGRLHQRALADREAV